MSDWSGNVSFLTDDLVQGNSIPGSFGNGVTIPSGERNR
jgi:hypothetical protein